MAHFLLRTSDTLGVAAEITPVVVGDSGAMSGHTRTLRANASGITLTAVDSGKQVSVEPGGGPDEVTLPTSPAAGYEIEFVCLADEDSITIHLPGLQRAYLGDSVSSAGGSIVGSSAGARLNLVYSAANLWIGIASGAWSLS